MRSPPATTPEQRQTALWSRPVPPSSRRTTTPSPTRSTSGTGALVGGLSQTNDIDSNSAVGIGNVAADDQSVAAGEGGAAAGHTGGDAQAASGESQVANNGSLNAGENGVIGDGGVASHRQHGRLHDRQQLRRRRQRGRRNRRAGRCRRGRRRRLRQQRGGQLRQLLQRGQQLHVRATTRRSSRSRTPKSRTSTSTDEHACPLQRHVRPDRHPAGTASGRARARP